jgi:hypothetical protein
MKMTPADIPERLFFSDPPTGRTNTISNQLMLRPVGALCWHSPKEHENDFTVWRDMCL